MSRKCQRCSHQNTPEAKFCLQCGAMLEMEAADASDPLVGKILEGRYRILSVLGEGGMGKVYVAEQKMGTATRKVAVKTLHPELSGDPQLVARFHRESATVIELNHPNTINFYDFGELDDHTLFIVMEYIEGESLAHALTRGALDSARIDKLLIQICGSLHEAHQIGVVHRDLKPENVLLTDRGGQTDFVKVLDFGIAKRSEAEDERNAKLTKQGMVLGTPPYMSPEQFSGQALDARSDIYSLAIMTFEMLTGQLPFDAKTPWEWATKHLTAEPKPLEGFPKLAGIPEHKKRAVKRALMKNRDERHPTVLEFLQEYTGYQDAQAAWTMATSSANVRAHSSSGGSQPRPPVGTPGPMPQSGQMHAAGSSPGMGVGTPPPYGVHTPAPYGAPTPAPFGAPTPAPYGQGTPPPYGAPTPPPGSYGHAGYASGSMDALPTSGGMGKIFAVLVIALFIIGGGTAGGLYWWMQRDPSPTPNPTPTPTPAFQTGIQPMDPANTENTTPMVPSTPSNTENATEETPENTAEETPENTSEETEETTEETPPQRNPPQQNDNAGDPAGLAAAQQGGAALDRDDLDGAMAALSRAQRALGRAHPQVRRLRSRLARAGGNKVGVLLIQGRCPDAQALFRRLRAVGAESNASGQFADWCRRP
jgi:serine/threonine-protein kinase